MYCLIAMTGSSPVLFRIYDHDVDLPIVASILGIILLALIQLSWPYIQSYLQPSPNIQERPVPVIETISEDPVPEAPKRRFVKDQSMIADWAAQAPLGTNGLSDRDDPNGISGMEGMKEVMVDSDGKVLDLDGSIIEPGKCISLYLNKPAVILNECLF